MNKRKIINDPVYGFINVESDLIYDIIEHPWFQRLRRIKQLGLTELVYPGALHHRFHHALGAMHLMGLALNNLRLKGVHISEEEYEAAQLAILLHDVGHGPFSHALEYSLLKEVHHEYISREIMHRLHQQTGGLELAIQIFEDSYPRKFFHQLISGQLDIDRLDYLKRDGFYTGVSEGTIGSDRIIKLLNIKNDSLVVEEKGIYSIEHFLIARRVMYWQVYLHKTTVSAENMLVKLLERARELSQESQIADDNLHFLLSQSIDRNNFAQYLEVFLSLDDFDIWIHIKRWALSPDSILRTLASGILERKLFKIQLFNTSLAQNQLVGMKFDMKNKMRWSEEETSYYFLSGHLSNEAYVSGNEKINVLMKNGELLDIADASDLPNIQVMSKIVKKQYVCTPKIVNL
ncbi:MAG: HD domain-containing protein [Cytophagaceae bacterium]|jgi:hypothetical protein|nr:HD domain-containing protein [Cytophagaceae bacterium]